MRKGHEQVREQMLKWYPDFDFTDAGIYYNDFNCNVLHTGENEETEAAMKVKRKRRMSRRRRERRMSCGDGITGDRCEHRSDTLCHAR